MKSNLDISSSSQVMKSTDVSASLQVIKGDNSNGSTPKNVNTQKQGQSRRKAKANNKQYRDDFSSQLENQISQGRQVVGTSKKNKISINHLLDFQSYTDLKEYKTNHSKSGKRRDSGNKGNRQHKFAPPKVHLQGMTFINVRYKFVVDYRKDYRVQELDPNVPLDTNDIIRIVVPKGNACPICLTEDQIAPRMITSCGHIICLKCVLSLLESEVPPLQKRESKAIVEKYRECPLCFSIIRKNELKPVLVHNIDERFETPKVDDEVVLTLMQRPKNGVLALPKALSQYQNVIDGFPWINQTNPDFNQYLRIFKSDMTYLVNMYDFERQQILANYEEEKLLYNESDTFVKLALAHIDQEISQWTQKLTEPIPPTSKSKHHIDNSSYYYYQTGFNAPSMYVLSPLDVKVLKSAYNNSYEELPSLIVAKIENIKYEELTTETSTSKFKYISNLPSGTQVGFMECNWYQNEFVDPNTWNSYKEELTKRTKNSKNKFRREELNKRKALDEEEIRNRNFYARENGDRTDLTDDEYSIDYATSGMGTLTIIDNRELPTLVHERHEYTGPSDEMASMEYQTTIWGTKIPKAEEEAEYEDEDYWDAEEAIRKAREEMEQLAGKGKKKKKKKMILLSSNY